MSLQDLQKLQKEGFKSYLWDMMELRDEGSRLSPSMVLFHKKIQSLLQKKKGGMVDKLRAGDTVITGQNEIDEAVSRMFGRGSPSS
jgi:hypothetical protein